MHIPPNHPSLLMKHGLLFMGRARNLGPRMDAMKAVADARAPRAPRAVAPPASPENDQPTEQ